MPPSSATAVESMPRTAPPPLPAVLNFYCCRCGQNIDADDSLAGMEVACPSCGKSIQVPVSVHRPAPEPAAQVERPAPPPSPEMPPESRQPHPPEPPAAPAQSAAKRWTKSRIFACASLGIALVAASPGSIAYSVAATEETAAGVAVTLAIAMPLLCISAAIIPALVIGGISAAFRKPFKTPVYVSTGILALPLAIWGSLHMHSMADSYRRTREVPVIREKKEAQPAKRLPDDNAQLMAESKELMRDVEEMQAEYKRRKAAEQAVAESRQPVEPGPDEELLRVEKLAAELYRDMALVIMDEPVQGESRQELLDFVFIKGDPGLVKTKAKLDRIRKRTRDNAAKASRIVDDIPARFEKHSIRKPYRKRGIRAYSELMGSCGESFNMLWDLELEALDRTAEILDFLDANREHWEADASGIGFIRDDKRGEYTKLNLRIDVCNSYQEEIAMELTMSRVMGPLNAELPEELDAAAGTGPEADLENQRVQQVMRAFAQRTAEITDKYEKAVSDEKIMQLLDFDRINREPNLHDSFARIARLRSALETAREEMLKSLEMLPDLFAKQGVKEPLKSPSTTKAVEALRTAAPLYYERWQLESKSIDAIERFLIFLHAHRGKWKDESAVFLFARSDEKYRYIELAAKIETIKTEQTKLAQKVVEIIMAGCGF